VQLDPQHPSSNAMRQLPSQQWLQNLQGVDALAILTDSDLISHKNGHALYYDGVEALENDCIIISAEPEYFLENLKDVWLSWCLILTSGTTNSQTYTRAYLSHGSDVRYLLGTDCCDSDPL